MPSGQHSQAKWAFGLRAPALETFPGHLFILKSAKSSDRTIQWRLGSVIVGPANGEIGANNRRENLHQLRVLQHFRRSARISPQSIFDLGLGKGLAVMGADLLRAA